MVGTVRRMPIMSSTIGYIIAIAFVIAALGVAWYASRK